MGRGLWTRSGHFVVVWWEDGLVRICDPASTQYERMNGDPVLFRSQVKYYWWVDARPFQKEEDDMTQEEFQRLAGEYLEQLGRRQPDPAWARRPGLGPGAGTHCRQMSTERPAGGPR